MSLRSNQMSLSGQELKWLPWTGATGKIKMSWSCFLNSHRYQSVENTFEALAENRKKILEEWAELKWDILGRLTKELQSYGPQEQSEATKILKEIIKNLGDFTELYIVDSNGTTLSSTYDKHINTKHTDRRALEQAMKGLFLHGPYVDKATLKIGNSSSRFSDEVTLMFYHSFNAPNGQQLCLCGRIPNDVMSDLIQREAGHVYPESGDNYLFMMHAKFDPSITQGIALSRSRFEDDSFTGGENLLSGVSTSFGVVKIQKHTEFEVLFTNPATKELHPGVRETIKNGKNIYVKYPGYADYRHIPVIGAGTTVKLKGSLDTWGMMCEGDLEEVYAFRSLPLQLCLKSTFCFLFTWLLFNVAHSSFELSTTMLNGLIAIAGSIGIICLWLWASNIGNKLEDTSHILEGIAEKGAPLSGRLDSSSWPIDQFSALGLWINSFLDRTESASQTLTSVASSVLKSANMLEHYTESSRLGAQQQSTAATNTASTLDNMLKNITTISDEIKATSETTISASQICEEGTIQVQQSAQDMRLSAESMLSSLSLVQNLEKKSESINEILSVIVDIANQTNLLALNASIEAARAGENGRGFAVVADEVKSLSQRTSDSATDITNMIASILTETREVARRVQECNDQVQRGESSMTTSEQALQKINRDSKESLIMIKKIVALSETQNEAGNAIEKNITEIETLINQNLSDVLNSAQAAHRLAIVGDELTNAAKRCANT